MELSVPIRTTGVSASVAVVGDLGWRRELVGRCRWAAKARHHAAGGGDRDESRFCSSQFFQSCTAGDGTGWPWKRKRCAVASVSGWHKRLLHGHSATVQGQRSAFGGG
uniref:Uncharacterized protein n=1 Tax=Manihot esculenta TaxID=3983 RepID=A0A2C9UQ07_MANES